MVQGGATAAPRNWLRQGAGWPNREASRFVEAGGLKWHVQDMGQGPVLLLVHGTGAATHSWGRLAPLLATRYRVIAPDLPGHGFTELAEDDGASLPGMSVALAELLRALKAEPELAVGHSAGAALLAYMSLQGDIAPAGLVSLNGAFLPFGRVVAPIFTGAARVLASLRLVPYLVALQATPRASVERFIRQTGSTLDREQLEWYRQVVRAPKHISATLRMMANWDLEALWRALPALEPALYLVACGNDQAVSPGQARRLARRMPTAELLELPGLGHLGHEEDPQQFDALLRRISGELGLS